MRSARATSAIDGSSVVVTVLVLGVALALRAWAAAGDFWLDEIWSWMAVRDQVHGTRDVFFAINHEANHILNSLWIHWLGVDVDWRWYRLPAVVAGSAAVLVARRLLVGAGTVAQAAVTLLCVPSLLLVNYSSEARGYGVMMLCAVTSLWLLEVFEQAAEDDRRGRRVTALMGFWVAAALGTLAHASYGATFVALALWAAVRVRRRAAGGSLRVVPYVCLFGPPTLFAAWVWVVNYLHVAIGGGPEMSAWQAAAEVCALALGGPSQGPWVWPLAALAMLALTLEIVVSARAGETRAGLWLAMLVVPAIPLAAGVHDHYVYPRFFLNPALFLLVALASLAARGWRAGGALRLLVCGALALITLGNLIGLAQLLRDGRGHPAAAVRWLAEHSHGPHIVAASDHTFRHGMVLEYYKYLLHHGQRIELLDGPRWPPQGPEWILRQDAALQWRPAPALHDGDGHSYALEALYPHGGLSGFTLALYHRLADAAPRRP